ncbi:hypothetical protein ACFQLX_02360 [Streptomyces polyrhachis]|uniref:Secreted protein n=1 Tax=Streptomyces polyrhachis TaxID=1282885 RepID=A0ABW2GDE0_9ACTN
MGSLRNPIGPLPATIYWRRRAVLAVLVALLSASMAWALTLGGDDGGDGKNQGDGPVASITPGPSESGPLISQRPGGRDEEDGGTTEGGDPQDPEAGTSGPTPGAENAAEAGGASGGGSDTSGTEGFPVGEDGVPAESALADCDRSAVTFTIRTVRPTYQADEKPRLKLTAANEAANACKLPFGPTRAVITIRATGDDTRVWSSADCPWTTNPILLEVPAGGTMERTITWDAVRSAPECGPVTRDLLGPGTYEAELKPSGLPASRTEFEIAG